MKTTKLPARLQKILDAIDTRMLEATREFDRTREAKEKEFGFKLAQPSGVCWYDVPKTKESDLDALVAAGLLVKRFVANRTMVARPNLPVDYYRSNAE